MKSFVVAVGCVFASMSLLAQSVSNRQIGTASEKHQRIGIVSDWSQRQIVFSNTNNKAVLARIQKDPRWEQSWYLHHREVWWPGSPRRHRKTPSKTIQRDWKVSLGNVSFGPIIDSGTGNTAPGGGQTFPAKYTFDITANPDCTNDFVAMGLPATASGTQANIVGYNNLYSEPGGTGFCSGTGPKMMFSYESGSGEVPASISISLDGKKLAYIEDILSGESFFHVLTIGTSDNNGSSPTTPAVPGGGNNASDVTVRLTPDSGMTNQSSTTAPFIDYQDDVAYVTTYSWATGDGYLYRISPVFGAGTPAITWVLHDNCSGGASSVPSSPVYDQVSDTVYFTDTGARLNWVTTPEGTPTLNCGTVGTFDNTAANPPVVDGINYAVYYGFNNNGANAQVSEQNTAYLGEGSLGINVGAGNNTYTGPYNVDFNNAYYDCDLSGSPCSGTPLLYVAGTDGATGTEPTLYAEGFDPGTFGFTDSGNTPTLSASLASGAADSSPVTEFYNATTSRDYLFVGVTDNCEAATEGRAGGCVMSLDITNGFPTISGSTTALPASGGPTGIVIDNDSSDPQASSIYYATKSSPATLVKATQSGLN